MSEINEIEESEEKVSFWVFALKHGVIMGLALIIYSTTVQLIGVALNPVMQWLVWGLVVGMLVWVFQEYKKNNKGFMSLGAGIGIGTIACTLAGLMGSVFSVVYFNLIDPTIKGKLLAQIQEQMETQNPNMTDEELEMTMQWVQMGFTHAWMIGFGTLAYLIFGFVLSLITAAIMKKDDTDPF
jgi:hypothetical protein